MDGHGVLMCLSGNDFFSKSVNAMFGFFSLHYAVQQNPQTLVYFCEFRIQKVALKK